MIESLITKLGAFCIGVISTLGYGGVVLLMAIESACIPLPSEIIMPFSGALAVPSIAAQYARAPFSIFWLATAGALGCNLGSAIAYWIGYYGGRPLVLRYGRYILLSQKELDLADHFFARYGNATVFISRLLPVIRTFIALPAGVAKMPQGRFHLYTFLGSWPWCFVLAYLGMKAGQNWRYLGKYFHEFDKVIGAVIVFAVVASFWTRWKHRVRVPEAA